jgi:hypothetical protein
MVCRHLMSVFAAIGVLAALPPALAQGQVSPGSAVGAALGAPPQPKVAAPPAPATVAPGSGSGSGADLDPAARAAALKAAIERCDLTETLALGGSAEDAARIRVAVDRIDNVVPGTARWIQTRIAASLPSRLSLAARTTVGEVLVLSAGWFGDFAPPGGLAGLPTADEAFGPHPASNEEFAQLFIQGMNAQDLATKWLARPTSHPIARDSTSANDPAQAYYMLKPYPGLPDEVFLVMPNFGTSSQGPLLIPLPGTKTMAGRADVLQQAPQIQVPDWVKDLPPPPLPPPPVTQC